MLNRSIDEQVVDEDDKHVGIVCEIVKTGACAFITPIYMNQRVYVHNTHAIGHMPNKLKLGRIVECMVQLDECGRTVAVNCKIINEEQYDKPPCSNATRDRSRSRSKSSGTVR